MAPNSYKSPCSRNRTSAHSWIWVVAGLLHTCTKFEVDLSFFHQEIVSRKHPTCHFAGLPLSFTEEIAVYAAIWVNYQECFSYSEE